MKSFKSITKSFKALVFILTALLYSCNGDVYEYWDISKFKLEPDALKDGEEVKILYTSRGPDSNRDLKYYIQIVAVSKETGDTVNILTTSDNGFKKEDGDKVFNYFNENNYMTKLGYMPEDADKIKHVKDFDNIQAPKIDKVARDPRYDYIANNKFPTVKGSVGTVTDTPEQP